MTGTGAGSTGRGGDARFIGDVPGRFVLPDRFESVEDAQSFPFSARSVSTAKAVVSTDIEVSRGERVVLNFEGIGIHRGTIERVLKGGFTVVFNAVEGGESASARIGWLNQKTRGRVEERRQHKRVIPKNAVATLILGADNLSECRVLDMSASGAAIQSPATPAVGSLVAVGAVPGRVVRHFDGGFAIRFIELQNLAHLEGQLTLRTSSQRSLAARRIGAAV